jgi:hypothetical protein
VSNNNTESDGDDDTVERDVLAAVQFRKGGEVIESVSESDIEIPREGEIVRIGEYQQEDDHDMLVFEGKTHIVRDVVHQYGDLPAPDDSANNMLLTTTTVVLGEVNE